MIKSMTGYGRGEHMEHNRKIIVEIKSVNHRYLDITIKLPRIMNALEDKLKKRITKQIQRGKIDVYVNMETFSEADQKIQINEVLAKEYKAALTRLIETLELNNREIPIGLVAGFPDIIKTEKHIYDDAALSEMWETLAHAAGAALVSFMDMREAEGKALEADILAKRAAIRELLDKMKRRMPFVVLDYEKRLRIKINELLDGAEPDENRLLTEIAMFAERSCVDEEHTRLESHLQQLLEILSLNEPVGKKLEFLIQEMNREANTTGSKSNDLEMNRLVVDLKCEIEKIREQIQNVE